MRARERKTARERERESKREREREHTSMDRYIEKEQGKTKHARYLMSAQLRAMVSKRERERERARTRASVNVYIQTKRTKKDKAHPVFDVGTTESKREKNRKTDRQSKSERAHR